MRSLLLLGLLAACATAERPGTGGPSGPSGPTGPTGPTGTGSDAGLSSTCAFSGMLATWSFASEPGSQSETPAAQTAPGVDAGSVNRAATLNAVSGQSSMNASNWAMSAQLDPGKYYAFTIAAPPGCSLGVTSVAIDAKSSGTGPQLAALATSADQFAQTASVSTTAPSTAPMAMSAVSGTLELRVFGFGATGTSGTMRLQGSLTVTGTIE